MPLLKTFPARTEGSVKKHWYKVWIVGTTGAPWRTQSMELTRMKDMHYADFAEDEVVSSLFNH